MEMYEPTRPSCESVRYFSRVESHLIVRVDQQEYFAEVINGLRGEKGVPYAVG